MLKYLRNKKAQSTLEYAVLVIIVIGALLSIQVYIKRGVQGRLRSATDDIGDQFEPYSGNLRVETYLASNTQDTFVNGTTRSELTSKETSYTNKEENMIHLQGTSYWGK